MRRTILFSIPLSALLLFSACGGGQTNTANTTTTSATPSSNTATRATATPMPETQVVNVTTDETKLAAGGAGEAAIKLYIAEGYHVHANPASDKFYIATEVQAAPQEGITPGKPVYPKALTRKLEFAETPLALYEGQPVIKLPLRADGNAAKGRHTFRVTVRVQACNDQACLPPRNIETIIPVMID